MAVTASGAVEAAVNGGRLSVCMAPLYIPLWIKPHPTGKEWQQEELGVSAFGVHQRHGDGLVVGCQCISSEWRGEGEGGGE